MNSEGTVYFIQPSELKETSKYKIGMSKENNLRRLITGYRKGTRFISIMSCKYPLILENMIKKKFTEKYKLIAGSEFFEGKEEEMLKDFLKIINENKDVNIRTNEKNIIKKYTNIIEKNINIIKKDTNIIKKDINIINKDNNIIEKDTNIIENDFNIGEKDSKYKCVYCNKLYKNYKSLWKHKYIYHKEGSLKIPENIIIEPSVNKCKFCEKQLSRKDNMIRHEKKCKKKDNIIENDHIKTIEKKLFDMKQIIEKLESVYLKEKQNDSLEVDIKLP
jgi:hypothetical protein